MSDQTRYKILFRDTTGFDLIREDACNLTKEKCDELLNYFINDGYNPNDLKLVKEQPVPPKPPAKVTQTPKDLESKLFSIVEEMGGTYEKTTTLSSNGRTSNKIIIEYDIKEGDK